jgi:hypothetical protein
MLKMSFIFFFLEYVFETRVDVIQEALIEYLMKQSNKKKPYIP